MDFSKVKLVVTDMDGTLLNSKSEVSDRFFTIFNQLKCQNIQFIAASGRQYHSIVDRLYPIKNDITIIAENGGMVKQGEIELFSTTLLQENCIKSIKLLRTISNTYIVLCGKEMAYIETEDEHFISMFQNYYSKFTIVKDLTKVADDNFLKIAAYHFECSETYIFPVVKHLENEMQVIVSGEHWLDISHDNANKGYALNILQNKWGITKEETMVFGDYNNDLNMLELGYFSYAMENAHPNVKNIAKFKTKSNNEHGVELVLEQMINSRNLI
ncbi:Cof-type HAD-IIB family hydrolase [Lutibacter sp.]|uniref:Cof-type HAD-IIB family hydrolase n=1 Tax=Lutibacter sp. TaxID=1925666 RepID=UPI002735A08A|nr:Cof-type HAD-IIB family hydrolase [Lutibacter sp.]MDP3313632.1 Cof-type HAD-IIB family hydrolase [Lutibacter sp.]